MLPLGPTREERFESEALPHMGNLLGTARRLTGSRKSAEDLVQETMLRGWRAFDQFATGTNCKGWLFRILFNLLSKQRQKTRARPPTVSLDEHCEHHELSAEAALPARLSPDEMFAALDLLPIEHRSVLILSIVEGFTCQEIADLQEIPIGTVMSRISRARANLRQILTRRTEITPLVSPPTLPAAKDTVEGRP